jgi:hypothetical protein
MSKGKEKRCVVITVKGEVGGSIINEYEEVGGPDDGAVFATIDLDNGQTITVKMSEMQNE